MKKFDAILFDMDGTLLPMDNYAFTKGYLGMLAKAVAPLGYTAETLVPAMWKGVGAMVKNDGTRTNADAFWDAFASLLGDKVYADIPQFDAFYRGDFTKAICFTQPRADAKEAVALAHKMADKVILATNPLFPAVAQQERMRWAGLSMEDFDLVTDYENSHFCKPNPQYYLEIAERCGFDPKNALMIGNNAEEDASASMAAGLRAYLITDCLICEGEMPDCPTGTFKEMLEWLRK